jgi:hypothetical protein
MTKFSTKRAPEEWSEGFNLKTGEMVVSADYKQVSSSVQFLLLSGGFNKFSVMANIGVDIGKREGVNFMAVKITPNSLSSDLVGPEDEIKIATIKIENVKSPGTKITIFTEFGETLKERIKAISTIKDVDKEFKRRVFLFIRNNKDRVSLGYGPNHPLENIHPEILPRDFQVNKPEDVYSNLGNWMVETHRRTFVNNLEYAFYLDGNMNVVGIIEGDNRSVRYPGSAVGSVKVSCHTHPTIESISFPSTTDISSAASRLDDNGISIIINSNGSPVINNDIQNRVPVMFMQKEEGFYGDAKEYYDSISGRMERFIEEQMEHKENLIHRYREEGTGENILQVLQKGKDKSKKLLDKGIHNQEPWDKLIETAETENVRMRLINGFMRLDT